MLDRSASLAMLRDLNRQYGTYEVTRMLHEVADATSREYAKLGNDGAIIHHDARELGKAVVAMRRGHPMRYPI